VPSLRNVQEINGMDSKASFLTDAGAFFRLFAGLCLRQYNADQALEFLGDYHELAGRS